MYAYRSLLGYRLWPRDYLEEISSKLNEKAKVIAFFHFGWLDGWLVGWLGWLDGPYPNESWFSNRSVS